MQLDFPNIPQGATVQLPSNNLGTVTGNAVPASPTPPVIALARAVQQVNVPNLAAFPVSGNHGGVVFVAGDIVMLAAQTTLAQNGPYEVGAVAGGLAPLIRPDWWFTGSVIQSGSQINIGSEDGLMRNTEWVSMQNLKPNFVVDTDDPQLWPRIQTAHQALAAGQISFGAGVFAIKSGFSQVLVSRRATGGTVTSTIMYAPTNGGADGVVTGPLGTATLIVQACLAAGTINNVDTSTLDVTIINRG